LQRKLSARIYPENKVSGIVKSYSILE